jgi:hypothetical protein
MAEERLARFTQWFRQRPTSLEFWEVVVTDERLVWCFVGESFSSLLLRADVGETGRREVGRRDPDDLLALNEENFAVPLADVRAVELDEGSRFRRASLTLTWEDEGGEESWTLSNTSDGDSQRDVVESLAADERLAHVDVTIEERGGLF